MESACAITSTLMGDKIEVSKDMDTETRRLPLGVCARWVFSFYIVERNELMHPSIASLRSISQRKKSCMITQPS